jgi:hypothetical protein
MELAVTINTHAKHTDVLLDSIDAISCYVSDKILVVVDAASWQYYNNVKLPAYKMEGLYHGCPKAPYRNVALALKTVTEMWPDANWYCYCEYDVLFGSDRFKANLKMAEERDVWMLGNDGHIDEQGLPLVQALIKEYLNSSYYLLGCCQFFHRNFINKLAEIDFFNKFLSLTSGFTEGQFPFYSGYDLSEHMYPTLCRHYGGNIGVFATYDHDGNWHGSHKYFPMRWRPDLDPSKDEYEDASIMHPVKDYDNPIREYHREKRKMWKTSQQKEKQSA